MFEKIDTAFVEEIELYIDENINNEYFKSYDDFYDHMWFLQDKPWFVSQCLETLKTEKLETFENFSYMLKTSNEYFDLEELKCDVDYVILSFICYIVSNNGERLYDHYKKSYNVPKLIDPKSTNNSSFIVDECAICYENKVLETTKCNHTFCNDCLFKIKTCSMCRSKLLENDTDNDDDDDDEYVDDDEE
jgi:hypothetical protein